ncbi:MAG: MobF family relaxase [Phycisphaerales bacterium]
MLRINQFTDADALKNYYRKALAMGDYFIHEHERPGEWRGEAAKRLGLQGTVLDKDFNRLCDNLHPWEESSLTPRTRSDRSVAYDFNWHVPKTISLLHAFTGDERIIDAIRGVVHDTMQEIERQALTRVRVEGKDENRTTSNLVWAEFVHLTTRPVDGVPDPHAHVHCIAFNATYDPVEERFKAAQFREQKRDAPYYEAAMYTRLAARLKDLGYDTERTGSKTWDLAGASPSLSKKFSRRTTEIEQLATKLGIVDPKLKAELGAMSRSRKDEGLNLGDLRQHWLDRLDPGEAGVLARIARGEAVSKDRNVSASEALEFAIGHKFVRESVVPMKRLLETALRFSLGQVSPEEMKQTAAQHPELLAAKSGDELFVTTREVLREERAMLAFARNGRGTCAALERDQPWAGPTRQLNEDQRGAVEHILKSQDRVMLVHGGAGTGKTTLMQEAVAAIRSRGTNVVAVAPTAEASRKVLRDSGFRDANTLEQLLRNPHLKLAARKTLIWVDEAGLVGTRDMKRLCDLAERINARVLLTGDAGQHAPVQRGDALRLLQSHAGLASAEVAKVVRQSGLYREAVENFAKGRFEDGFKILDRLGAIRELPDNVRSVQIARDYTEAVRTGRSCLVISPTHAEGEQIAGLIRAELRHKGLLGEDFAIVNQLRDRRLTTAERSDAASYRPGDVVQFYKHANKFRAAETVRVVGHNDKGQVRVLPLKGGSVERLLPLHQSERFSVFEQRSLPLAPGERIRITHTGRTKDGKHRLENGATYRIAGFNKEGHLELDNGWVVRRSFSHVAHAYTSTSHSTQAKTTQLVLLSQTRASMAAASAEQWYVSISRGAQELRVYTDDRQALTDAVSRMSSRRSATELFESTPEQKRNPAADQQHAPAPTRAERATQHAHEIQRLKSYQRTVQSQNHAYQRQRERQRARSHAIKGFTRGR